MTIDEYTEKLQHGVLNADEMPGIVTDVLKELKADLTALDTIKADNAKKDAEINTLRETNMKLFLSVPGNTAADKKEDTGGEEAPAIDWESVVKDIKEVN